MNGTNLSTTCSRYSPTMDWRDFGSGISDCGCLVPLLDKEGLGVVASPDFE